MFFDLKIQTQINFALHFKKRKPIIHTYSFYSISSYFSQINIIHSCFNNS